MRHGKHKYKLSVKPSHRKSMIRNLASDIIAHGQIKTTVAKCKAVKPFIERLVTIARTDTVANRRLAFKKLDSAKAVKKLFADVAPKYTERPGGYTRITKLADRRVGDGSEMSYISFV
ncbi:50S ribosomal protein L17 [Bacteriovoracaceae bacterium]|nr:50S ribosomal protein L17 [Bacteriovoracaceae bacterium]